MIAADWVMLQTETVYRRLSKGTEAGSRTNTGYEVRASLSLASPPSSSFHHLDTPGVPAPTTEEHGFNGGSAVVAADRNRLLPGGLLRLHHAPDRGQPPSLHCLPALSGRWRCNSGDAGIACSGNDFVVAVLNTFLTKPRTSDSGGRVRRREAAKLARFFSSRRRSTGR
ncbi:hypothetical protein E2562_014220 [Oryza meyeriana var. granulata]|uniref:Uncharacterized protein n=1 Tax=Oryza meyeriana var. granulata TaxID=110450 RepID=A0A6G1BLU6_9ORYZ|nr:hypothetical protein E2562_014220 [Oryza meyeriana var. granulata]